jgi:hypothetical protein
MGKASDGVGASSDGWSLAPGKHGRNLATAHLAIVARTAMMRQPPR